MGVKKGDLVKLTNPSPAYNLGKDNPAVGTKWECEGVVSHITISGTVFVDWDTGLQNAYSEDELSLARDGVLEDIWENIEG